MGARAWGRPRPCTPGPLGEGLRLGLAGKTPPRSLPCPLSAVRFLWHPGTRHAGFWKLGGLIRALILATGCAGSRMMVWGTPGRRRDSPVWGLPRHCPGSRGPGIGCGGPGSEGCLGPLSGHPLGCLRSPCLSLPWGCQDQRRLAGTGGRVPVGSVAPCWGRAETPWPLGRAQGPWPAHSGPGPGPSPVTAALRKDSSGGPTAHVRVCTSTGGKVRRACPPRAHQDTSALSLAHSTTVRKHRRLCLSRACGSAVSPAGCVQRIPLL